MTNKGKVLLIGGSGFLGSEIAIGLVRAGYEINLLGRSKKPSGYLSFPSSQFTWQADGSVPESAALGVEAIVNLAGESISTGRWTTEKRRRIVESRVDTARRVAEAAKKYKIKTVIQASAIGIYGDTGGRSVDETAEAGKGFLASTSSQWEEPLKLLGESTRRVTMRIGVVLGTTGGALTEMLQPYAIGVGAAVGSGNHYLSWVHVKDICRFVLHAIQNSEIAGDYNLTAPNPVTYQQLHEALVLKFGGFKWLKIPAQFLQIALGKKSELLLTSQRVVPKKTLEDGFQFEFVSLTSALDDLLGSYHSDCSVMDVKQWIPASSESVWSFFCSEKNLEKLTPSFLQFKVEGISTPSVQENSLINYRLKIHGIPVKWKSQIKNFNPGESFQDIQLKGPYHTWHHTHNFSKLGGGTLIQDYIKFKVPLGLLGGVFAYPFVKRDINKIFQYRRKMVSEIFSKKEEAR